MLPLALPTRTKWPHALMDTRLALLDALWTFLGSFLLSESCPNTERLKTDAGLVDSLSASCSGGDNWCWPIFNRSNDHVRAGTNERWHVTIPSHCNLLEHLHACTCTLLYSTL